MGHLYHGYVSHNQRVYPKTVYRSKAFFSVYVRGTEVEITDLVGCQCDDNVWIRTGGHDLPNRKAQQT